MARPRPSVPGRPASNWLAAVLWTGLLVGVVDYAIGFGIFVAAVGRPWLGALQAPAAGVLGPVAFRGGAPTAVLGIALHFLIALGWTALYALLFHRCAGLRRVVARPLGLLAVSVVVGALVWLVMNEILAPLGRGRPEATGSRLWWAVLAGHLVFVGLPLVWGLRRYAPPDAVARTAA